MPPDPGRDRQLSELLAGGPDRAAFRALLGLFAGWPEGEDRDAALDRAEAALDRWPDEVRQESVANRFVQGPQARLLRGLEAVHVDQNGGAFARLMLSPELGELRNLEITDSSVDLRALAASPHVRRLARLKLVGQAVTDEEGEAIAASDALVALESLELIDTRSPGPFLAAVRPQQLRRLVLRDSLGVDDKLAPVLARPEVLEGLSELDLSRNNLRDPDGLALARAAELRNLASLDLRENLFTPAVQAAIRAAFAKTRVHL